MTATDGSPHSNTAQTGERRLPESVVSELLADEECRRVLSCLADHDGPVAVEDLARAVVARESGVEPDAADPETVQRRRDELFQRHLPRLAPTGVVLYDSMLATVALDTTDERILDRLD